MLSLSLSVSKDRDEARCGQECLVETSGQALRDGARRAARRRKSAKVSVSKGKNIQREQGIKEGKQREKEEDAFFLSLSRSAVRSLISASSRPGQRRVNVLFTRSGARHESAFVPG